MARLTNQQNGNAGPPPRSPFLPPSPPPRLPPADVALQQRATAALVLGLLSLIAMTMVKNLLRAPYVFVVTLVIALTALALTISAMRAAKRARTRRPRAAVASLLFSALASALSGLMLISMLVFWTQFSQFANCMNGASTISAKNACTQQLQNAVNHRLNALSKR